MAPMPTQAQATARYIKTSVQKLGLVAELIRRQPVDKALATLAFCPKKVAFDVRKVLMSAIANADHNLGLDVDTLVVERVEVGKAFVLKRMHCRGRGRGARVEKPFSRLTVIVAEQAKQPAQEKEAA
jgi:large subunit ribosomal protein L22